MKLRTGMPRGKTWTWQIGLLGLLALVPHTSPAPLTAYMKIPDIPGESQDSNHDKWINLDSVSSGLTVPIERGMPGPADFGDMVFTKRVDASSPLLALACARGDPIPGIDIQLTRTTDAGQEAYYQYKLEKVLVTSYQLSGDADERPIESFSLNYAKIEWFYWKFGADGESIWEAQAYWDLSLSEGGYSENNSESAAPVIWPLGTVKVQPGEAQSVATRFLDADTPLDELSVSVSTTRPDLVTDLQISGAGENRTISFVASSLYSGSASVSLSVSDGENTTSLSFTVLIDVEMTPWEAFIAAYFTPEEQLDLDLVSPLGDPDGDRIKTVMEFGLGTNPREFTDPRDAITVWREETDSGPVIRIEFNRHKDAGKLGPKPWMAPESLLFEPLSTSGTNPLYEESVNEGTNPLYEQVSGTIHLDPEQADANMIRLQIELD